MDCKDIRIRKLEYVAKNQFFFLLVVWWSIRYG